ncbi:MAG: addiction module protein [Kiritimatiellae bacterium]|nr:addiction module protein [Kiritimatiellia bacterium]
MRRLLKADALTRSVPERIQLVEDIWDTIAEVPEEIGLTDEQKAEPLDLGSPQVPPLLARAFGAEPPAPPQVVRDRLLLGSGLPKRLHIATRPTCAGLEGRHSSRILRHIAPPRLRRYASCGTAFTDNTIASRASCLTHSGGRNGMGRCYLRGLIPCREANQ